MKPTLILLPLLALGIRLAAAEPPAGFTALFNGNDLRGWHGGSPTSLTDSPTLDHKDNGMAHWSVKDGEMINDGVGLYATTDKDYRDFEMLVDWKIAAHGDSGVYLKRVPQVQIWDPTQDDPKGYGRAKGSGGLWNNTRGTPGRDPLVRADRPIGEWNHFRILMVGSRVSVWLNDQLVVDHAILENYFDRKLPAAQRKPIPVAGPLQLQTHGNGETRWRNLYIREIGSDEACKILASHGSEGFEPIFNGKNLDGWAGPLDQVRVQDGAIVWQSGRSNHGNIYWNHNLADFQARLKIKLPPGGNNGLAIRYPGKGTPAYDGNCEIQVLDDNYEKVKGPIDPRQADGSAYGMVAAARGYQHPIGEWNFEEVTVKGPKIRVELNGSIILDTDLSAVDLSTVMAHHAHPGKDRVDGFFGFAGHGDPVEFKNIAIKPL